eukprot:gene10999-7642_t
MEENESNYLPPSFGRTTSEGGKKKERSKSNKQPLNKQTNRQQFISRTPKKWPRCCLSGVTGIQTHTKKKQTNNNKTTTTTTKQRFTSPKRYLLATTLNNVISTTSRWAGRRSRVPRLSLLCFFTVRRSKQSYLLFHTFYTFCILGLGFPCYFFFLYFYLQQVHSGRTSPHPSLVQSASDCCSSLYLENSPLLISFLFVLIFILLVFFILEIPNSKYLHPPLAFKKIINNKKNKAEPLVNSRNSSFACSRPLRSSLTMHNTSRSGIDHSTASSAGQGSGLGPAAGNNVDAETVLVLIRRLMHEQQQRHEQQQSSILQLYSELNWNVKQLRDRVNSLEAAGALSGAALGGGAGRADGFPCMLQTAAAAVEKNRHGSSTEPWDVATLQRKVWGAARRAGGGATGRPDAALDGCLEDTQSASSTSNREEGVTPQRRPPVAASGSRGTGGGLHASMSPVRSEAEENVARDLLDEISDDPSPSVRAVSSSRVKAEALYEDLMGHMMRDELPLGGLGSTAKTMGGGRLDQAGGFSSGLLDANAGALRGPTAGMPFGHADTSINTPSRGGVATASADASGIADEAASLETLRILRELPGTVNTCATYSEGRPHVKVIASGTPGADDPEAHGLKRTQPYHVLVEFKRHRAVQYESDIFVAPGKYVVVAADRGEDLGLVICTWCETLNAKLGAFATSQLATLEENPLSIKGIRLTNAHFPNTLRVCRGTVLRLASDTEVSQLHYVQAELERRAIDVCNQRVLERKVPMVLVDAEYQYDSKKLTFFYEAQQRTDFRELVRDLFKSFRARIWMEMLALTGVREQEEAGHSHNTRRRMKQQQQQQQKRARAKASQRINDDVGAPETFDRVTISIEDLRWAGGGAGDESCGYSSSLIFQRDVKKKIKKKDIPHPLTRLFSCLHHRLLAPREEKESTLLISRRYRRIRHLMNADRAKYSCYYYCTLVWDLYRERYPHKSKERELTNYDATPMINVSSLPLPFLSLLWALRTTRRTRTAVKQHRQMDYQDTEEEEGTLRIRCCDIPDNGWMMCVRGDKKTTQLPFFFMTPFFSCCSIIIFFVVLILLPTKPCNRPEWTWQHVERVRRASGVVFSASPSSLPPNFNTPPSPKGNVASHPYSMCTITIYHNKQTNKQLPNGPVRHTRFLSIFFLLPLYFNNSTKMHTRPGGPPPPAPQRQQRPKFLTAYLDLVLPFLDGASLLTCTEVSRVWREEANALSLWRRLVDLREEELRRAGVPISTAPLPLSLSGFTLREMKRLVLQPLPSRCPIPEVLLDDVEHTKAEQARRDQLLLSKKTQQAAEFERRQRTNNKEGTGPMTGSGGGGSEVLPRMPVAVSAQTIAGGGNITLSSLFCRAGGPAASRDVGLGTVASRARRAHDSGNGAAASDGSPTSIASLHAGLPPEPKLFHTGGGGSSSGMVGAQESWQSNHTATNAEEEQRRASYAGSSPHGQRQRSPPGPSTSPSYGSNVAFRRREPTNTAPGPTFRPELDVERLPAPERRQHPPRSSNTPPWMAASSAVSEDPAFKDIFRSASWVNGSMPSREGRIGPRPKGSMDLDRRHSHGRLEDGPQEEQEEDGAAAREQRGQRRPAPVISATVIHATAAEPRPPPHANTSGRKRDPPPPPAPRDGQQQPPGEATSGKADSEEKPAAEAKNTGAFSAGLKAPFTPVPAPALAKPTEPAVAPSFGYELTGPQELTQHRATTLLRSMEKLSGMLQSEHRILLHQDVLLEAAAGEMPSERFLAAQRECTRLLQLLQGFEEVVAQAILRDASRQQRSVLTHPPTPRSEGDTPPPLLPKTVQSFVELELLTMRCRGSPLDTLWKEFQAALPLNDQFYNMKDFLLEWGPEWRPGRNGRGSTARLREEALATMIQEKLSAYFQPVGQLLALRAEWGKAVPWDQVLVSVASHFSSGCPTHIYLRISVFAPLVSFFLSFFFFLVLLYYPAICSPSFPGVINKQTSNGVFVVRKKYGAGQETQRQGQNKSKQR